MNKTTISEELEPPEDFTEHHYATTMPAFHTNFENNSLRSDTLCTSDMNSLHVNLGSEEAGDAVSSHVLSSEEEYITSGVQGVQAGETRYDLRVLNEGRKENELPQGRKDQMNETSSNSTGIQTEIVDHRRATVFSKNKSSSNVQSEAVLNRQTNQHSNTGNAGLKGRD